MVTHQSLQASHCCFCCHWLTVTMVGKEGGSRRRVANFHNIYDYNTIQVCSERCVHGGAVRWGRSMTNFFKQAWYFFHLPSGSRQYSRWKINHTMNMLTIIAVACKHSKGSLRSYSGAKQCVTVRSWLCVLYKAYTQPKRMAQYKTVNLRHFWLIPWMSVRRSSSETLPDLFPSSMSSPAISLSPTAVFSVTRASLSESWLQARLQGYTCARLYAGGMRTRSEK